MKRELILYLRDILRSIEKIASYSKGIDKDNFFKNTEIQDAIVRRIEIIGEAAKNIPGSFREKYPKIPWKDVAGMRDILTHAYFEINLDMVWKVIKEDLLELKKNIKEILKKEVKKIRKTR